MNGQLSSSNRLIAAENSSTISATSSTIDRTKNPMNRLMKLSTAARTCAPIPAPGVVTIRRQGANHVLSNIGIENKR